MLSKDKEKPQIERLHVRELANGRHHGNPRWCRSRTDLSLSQTELDVQLATILYPNV
jgi:hypothetical protein